MDWKNREQKQITKLRYARPDDIRGITLVSMICYHAVWDLVYIFKVDWGWFRTDLAYVWQQLICWSFIGLSGYCWSLGSHQFKRGIQVFCAGAIVSLVTEIVTPDQRIRFGILTFLGMAMLIMIPLEKVLRKIPARVGLILCGVVFLLLKGINDGYIGFSEQRMLWKLPEALYHMGDVGTIVGFADRKFFSADYFALLPWMFLYLTGYFVYKENAEQHRLEKLSRQKSWGSFWCLLGKNSLVIYMLHQPVIYGVLLLLDKLRVI